MAWTPVLALLCLAGIAFAIDENSDAKLLASKTVLNQFMVENKDLTVQYSIYNVGGRAATNVKLSDASFPEEDFEVVRGFLNVEWQRIAPGSNVTHTVILRPHSSGYFNFTSAEISYQPSESSTDVVYGYTSSHGEDRIVKFRDYDRKFSSHMLDWLAFGVMTLPSLCIPLLLWYRSKCKYDSIKKKN